MVKQDLTKAEQLIMKCIWDTPKEMVLSEILTMANERYCKGWKPQTVSTYLSHLVQKKFLKMTRTGKIYTYQIIVSEREYFEKSIKEFCEFWGMEAVVDYLNANDCIRD